MEEFFDHYSSQFGLTLGWIFEGTYDEFVSKNERIYKSTTCLVIKNLYHVTEWDIYQLSKGVICSDNALHFVRYLDTKSNTDSIQPILVSCHSGSSDYLTPKKVKEFIKHVDLQVKKD